MRSAQNGSINIGSLLSEWGTQWHQCKFEDRMPIEAHHGAIRRGHTECHDV
jgi:hypothetical protein